MVSVDVKHYVYSLTLERTKAANGHLPNMKMKTSTRLWTTKSTALPQTVYNETDQESIKTMLPPSDIGSEEGTTTAFNRNALNFLD